LTWNEFASYINVSSFALKEWYFINCLLPLEVFEIINSKYVFDRQIIEIKNENWGQSKGGLISKGNKIDIIKPGKTEKLAELVGIILGDGNINRFAKGKKVATYALRICGHSEKDYDYLTNFVSKLINSLFETTPHFFKAKNTKASYIIVNSKEVIDFLLKIGLITGNKVKNQVGIPAWIMENKTYSESCLRGLIDTDGSIFRMSKKDPNLLRISFKNHSYNLLKDTRKILLNLNFHPSKIIRNNVIYLSRKKDLEKYLNDIGFNNSKHTKRLKSFSPVV